MKYKYIILCHHPLNVYNPVTESLKSIFYNEKSPLNGVAKYIYVKSSQSVEVLSQSYSEGITVIFCGIYSLISRQCNEFITNNNIKTVFYCHDSTQHLNHVKNLDLVNSLFESKNTSFWFVSNLNKNSFLSVFNFLKEKNINYKIVYNIMNHTNIVKNIPIKEKDYYICASSGYAIIRKGFDFFDKLSKNIPIINGKRVFFVWLGYDIKEYHKYLSKNGRDFSSYSMMNFETRDNFLKYFQENVDFTIQCSHEEPFSLFSLESVAFNKPVFVKDTVGISEILDEKFIFTDEASCSEKINNYFLSSDKDKESVFKEDFTLDMFINPNEFVKRAGLYDSI